jgi:predicted heme/steroid binding protein
MVPKAKDHVAAPAHGGGAERSFTPQEVEKHNKSDDVWLIVRDAVYDVSKFVDRHPGGDLILLQKGRDVTSMFESLHPSTAQKTLDKFKIGTVAAGSVRSTITFPPAEQRNFYPTLKARVEEYFKTSGEKRRDNPRMYLKALSIIAFTLTAWCHAPPPPLLSATTSFSSSNRYFTFISASPSLPLRFLFAAAWGCGMALVGVAIQHDANHGAMSNNKHVCTVFGATLDYLSGASSYMWRQQHDYGHHSYTNIHDKDPDIRVTETDIRRVTKWQPLHKWHYGQHIYLPILYSLLGLKSVFIDDYAALCAALS